MAAQMLLSVKKKLMHTNKRGLTGTSVTQRPSTSDIIRRRPAVHVPAVSSTDGVPTIPIIAIVPSATGPAVVEAGEGRILTCGEGGGREGRGESGAGEGECEEGGFEDGVEHFWCVDWWVDV